MLGASWKSLECIVLGTPKNLTPEKETPMGNRDRQRREPKKPKQPKKPSPAGPV